MIGYTSLGTNDLRRAGDYYDALLTLLGAVRAIEAPDYIAWGRGAASPLFSIHEPADGRPATVGNGVMVALLGVDSDQVRAVHRRALELGSQDEGPPGPRGDGGFYAAYFRDLDGNKLNVHCMTAD